MRKLLILVLTITTLLSCSNDDDSATDPIVGEWKLTKAEYYAVNVDGLTELQTVDYSDETIIYSFSSNNQLTVTGGDNVGYPEGQFDYLFEEDYLGGFTGEGETEILLVKINDSKWTYDYVNGIMKLGRTYVDGPDLYFELQ